jgi:uncharacterized RDD family membrane protein YckC
MNDSQIQTYAGVWQRVKAFVLDYIIILCYLAAITILFFLINSLSGITEWMFLNRIRAQLTGFFLITLPVSLYFVFGESSVQRATWGKKRIGLAVTDLNGARLTFWRSFTRTLLKFIPWELSHTLIWQINFSPQANSAFINYRFILVYVLIGLNIVSLLMTKKHQTVYDLLAKTYVAKIA